MKNLLLILFVCISSVSFAQEKWVEGYYKSDGSYVEGYWRNTDPYRYKKSPEPKIDYKGTPSIGLDAQPNAPIIIVDNSGTWTKKEARNFLIISGVVTVALMTFLFTTSPPM